MRRDSGKFNPQRETLKTRMTFIALPESGVPGSGILDFEEFSVKTQEDQPAKVSDGFGQKVYDEGFVKVISAVGRKASQSGRVCRLNAVAAIASNIRHSG